MMKLHWGPMSPFVRKVMVAVHELGLADRIEKVRTVVAMTRPNHELMRENPLGKIPALITDDGWVWFDSLVICEYLDGLHSGPRLFPAEPRARLQALRWHALGNGMLDTAILWRNERLRPEPGQSPEMLAGFELKTRNALDQLEREAAELSSHPVGIGHVAIACALGYLDFRFAPIEWRHGRQRIRDWYELMATRPSMQRTRHYDDSK